MSRNLKWTLAGTLAVLAIVFLVWTTTGHLTAAGGQDKEEEEKPIHAPSHVSVQNGETVVTLDAATQARLGLSLTTLKAFSNREQLRAPATVLLTDDLTSLRDAYLAARVKLEKARINEEMSRKEYERLQSLYQNDQNTSLKALEAAQAAFNSDQADAESAEHELALQSFAAQQRWGKVVAGWLASGSPEFQRLLDQQELLVQVTLPSGETFPTPETADLQGPDGRMRNATLVSPFPRLDPRLQGASFLYLTAFHPSLTPGLNLVALLPVGKVMRGTMVPSAGVVWWQGRAWVYQQTSSERFVRRQLSTDNPVQNDWFVSSGFSAGDTIVTSGAQMLFSEEFRSQIKAAEEQ
jgi:hypothetical protein